MTTLHTVAALLLAGAFAACGSDPGGDDDPIDAAPAEVDAYPPPLDDLVSTVGSAGAVDVATWNIENFPLDTLSAKLAADIVTSMDLDLVCVQEIENIDAWNELVARLPEHDGALSSHTYGDGSFQKVGFLYRRDLLALSDESLLFTDEGYVFPRPPMKVSVTVTGTELTFDAVVVHLKAGRDDEDAARREAAIAMLDEWMQTRVDAGVEDEILLLGDFNEIVTSFSGQTVMAPLLDDPGRYEFLSESFAESGGVSFLPSEVVLDHIVASDGLRDELAGEVASSARIDLEFSSYRSLISDHIPVYVAIPVL